MVEILKKDKILFSVILSACIFLNGIFSSEDFISPKVIDVRSLSLGDLYITDYNSPYILFTNPAGLSVTGKKTLLAPSNMDLGGPLSAIPSVISNAIKSDNIFQSLVAGLLSETLSSNENFLDFETLLPLSFVRINKNNGVGFINRLFVNRAISVDSNTNFSFGLEGLFIIGNSSTIIKTKRQVLSVGTSTKLLGRMDVNHTDTVENFLNIDFMNLPVRGTLAIVMDVGIQYSLLKFFSVAAVWQNAFLGLEKNLNTLTDLSFSQEGVIPNIFLNKGNLNLGFSLSLPIAFTKGIISNWKIYAN